MSKTLIDGIVGTRPNMMKMAPLCKAIEQDGSFELRLIHTGQHYDENMSDVFLRQLGLPAPAANFMVGSGSHAAQTAKIMTAYEQLLQNGPKPKGTIVVGDVTSTMACSLTAVKMGIPIAHVEAGLRSFDREMPEEINRIVTDSISDILFVTDPDGVINLAREGHAAEKIKFVGNVMIDTLMASMPLIKGIDVAELAGVEAGKYAYVSLHRPSNVDNPETLRSIISLLGELSDELPIVFAIHPRTRQRLDDFAITVPQKPGLKFTAPFGYHENMAVIRSARMVLSDSGGIQEESSVLGVPCLTLRFNTERPCTVEYGSSELVGNDTEKIREAWGRVMAGNWKKSSSIPLWDGNASQRIIDFLKRVWK